MSDENTAPAVRELDDWKSRGSKLAAEELEYQLNQCPPDTLFYMAHMRALGWLYSQAARISQLEAGLAVALPYVEAANRAEHLMDGFGPRSRQSSDDHVAAIRAIICIPRESDNAR
jgi:hypothetical protein